MLALRDDQERRPRGEPKEKRERKPRQPRPEEEPVSLPNMDELKAQLASRRGELQANGDDEPADDDDRKETLAKTIADIFGDEDDVDGEASAGKDGSGQQQPDDAMKTDDHDDNEAEGLLITSFSVLHDWALVRMITLRPHEIVCRY